MMMVLSNGLLDNEECDEHLNDFVIYREDCAGYLVYLLNYPAVLEPVSSAQRRVRCTCDVVG